MKLGIGGKNRKLGIPEHGSYRDMYRMRNNPADAYHKRKDFLENRQREKIEAGVRVWNGKFLLVVGLIFIGLCWFHGLGFQIVYAVGDGVIACLMFVFFYIANKKEITVDDGEDDSFGSC